MCSHKRVLFYIENLKSCGKYCAVRLHLPFLELIVWVRPQEGKGAVVQRVVAVCCCSVLLQCVVAVCCRVLQWSCAVRQHLPFWALILWEPPEGGNGALLQCVAVCCSVVQCGAVWCSVLQCVAVCCSVLQCGAVWCSVLQCVAVCCSVLQCVAVCGFGASWRWEDSKNPLQIAFLGNCTTITCESWFHTYVRVSNESTYTYMHLVTSCTRTCIEYFFHIHVRVYHDLMIPYARTYILWFHIHVRVYLECIHVCTWLYVSYLKCHTSYMTQQIVHVTWCVYIYKDVYICKNVTIFINDMTQQIVHITLCVYMYKYTYICINMTIFICYNATKSYISCVWCHAYSKYFEIGHTHFTYHDSHL